MFLLLLLSAGIFQLYPPIGWVDPGLYIHWFMTPSENMVFRGGNYHAARLPYVLPGAALYALTDPSTAQALLVVGYSLLGFLAVYILAAGALRQMSSRVALALIFSMNPLWLAAYLRGYVDGPGIALGLLSLGLLLRGESLPGRVPLALSGATLFLALAVHPFAGALVGLTALLVLALRSDSVGRFFTGGAMMMVGAGLALLVLGAIGSVLGMPFFFLGMSSAGVTRAFSGQGSAFTLPLSAWLPSTPRVLLLPLAIGLALAGVRQVFAGERDRLGLALAGAAFVPLAVFLGLQPLGGSNLPFTGFILLQYPFYASYLFLALVPASILFLRGLERSGRVFTWPASLALVAATLLSVIAAQQISLAQRDSWLSPGMVWGCLGVLLIFSFATLAWRPGRWAFVSAVCTLGLVGLLNRDTANVLRLEDGADHAAQQRSLAALHQILRASGLTKGNYLVWYNRDSFTAARKLPAPSLYLLNFRGQTIRMNMLDSLAASLGWDRSAIGFAMPEITAPGTAVLNSVKAQPRPLVLLCTDAADCERGFSALENEGFVVARETLQNISEAGSAPLTVAIAKIAAPRPAAIPRS